jgi:hypothetical protein
MEQLGLNQILQNQFNHSNLNNNEEFNRYNNYVQNINSQNTDNIFSIINNENMNEDNNSNEIIENIENRFNFDSFENINNIENVYEQNLNNQNLYENNNEISDNNSNIDIDSSNPEDTSTVNSCDINISNNNSLFNKQKTDSPSNVKSKISLNSDLIYNDNYQKRRKSMDLIPFNKFYTFKKSFQFKILESTYYNTNKLNMIKNQGKFDFESEEGNEICKECLQNIENLIKSFKVKISNRDYRKKFTKAYIFLYQEDSLCYLTEILDSAQEATPDLVVNGEKYIFSKEVIERGNQLFVSFCSLIMLITEVVNFIYDEIIIEDDKLNIMINDLKNCLFEFDKKWTLYEEKYIMELIYIEKISRRYIFEGIKLEKELSLYEKRANIKGKNLCENDKEYNNIRDKFIKVINYLNKIANINGKGRDDLDINILLQSEKVLRTVTEVQSNGLRKLANNIKKALNDLRNLFRKYNLNIEGVDPQLLNNPELVSNLDNFEQIWEKGKMYLCNQKKYNYLMGFNKIIEIINEKYKGKDISSLIEESDPKIIVIIPAILILKAIDSKNYEIINNFIPNVKKDKLFISIKETIKNVYKKVKDPYYAYNLFEKLLLFNEGKDENSIIKEMEKYIKNEEIKKFIKNIKILSINMQRDNPSEWNEFFQLAMDI